jgi:glutamyl-tRNA reductase
MLYVIGLNHQSASLDLREQVSIAPTAYPHVLKKAQKKLNEGSLVLLSTCNRTELYLSLPKALFSKEMFTQLLELPLEIPPTHLYLYREEEAVAHLFRVVSGINSMIIGENQIVGQVKHAFSIALDQGCTDPTLNKLFQFALETNKLVRSRTAIAQGAVSVSYAAAELMSPYFLLPVFSESPFNWYR